MKQIRSQGRNTFQSLRLVFFVVLGLNAVFLLIAISASFLPSNLIVRRVQHAFSTGDLVESDYLKYDARRGFHQYNDCNILQMMANSDSSRLGRALGPWGHMADASASEACRTLRELVVDGRDPVTYVSSRYTRYWHGYIPVLYVLLEFLEISSVRKVLQVLVYMGVLLPLLSSAKEKRLLRLTGPISIAGAFFWGLPYFGQGMSHALGDTVVMLGIAGLIFWHRQFTSQESLALYCAIFGTLVVYFEMLTGPLPVAAGLLFPAAYLISRINNPPETGVRQHYQFAALALVSFAAGAIITLSTRILLAAALVQPNGLDSFAGHFAMYIQPVESTAYVPGFLRPFGRLLRRGEVLTYGSEWALAVLYGSTALAWLAAMYHAIRQKSILGWADLGVFVIGAASVPTWTIILQAHTFMHADFMARILIVPISLGWACALWQLGLIRDPGLLPGNTLIPATNNQAVEST